MSLPFSWEAYSSQGVSILVANMPPQSLLVESGIRGRWIRRPGESSLVKGRIKVASEAIEHCIKKVHVDLSFML
jgi:hypothetical protein